MRPVIRAGQLRHNIVIQERSATQDAYGGEADTWTDLDTVRAEIRPLTGREYSARQSLESEVTHEICIRYYAGLTAKHRLKFGTRYFLIQSVLNLEERNAVMKINAIEQHV